MPNMAMIRSRVEGKGVSKVVPEIWLILNLRIAAKLVGLGQRI